MKREIFTKTKGHKIFWTIVIILFCLMLLELGLRFYEQWRGQKDVQEFAEALEEWERGIQQAKENDKIGGKTPSETLQMFIDAVEAGDYELASKYFVVEKQEKWKNHLPEIAVAGKVNLFLSPLAEISESVGNFELNSNNYVIHDPVLVSFILYPSGNWKIEKI